MLSSSQRKNGQEGEREETEGVEWEQSALSQERDRAAQLRAEELDHCGLALLK